MDNMGFKVGVCKMLWEHQKAVLVLILVGVEGRIKEGVLERLGPEDCRIEQGCVSRRNSKSIRHK